MPVRSMNLLFIMSDQHNRQMSGCYGHPIVKTPNLDGLAARGVLFTNAYCNCPICVPSRASMATGRYCHQIRCWDNASPYTGQAPSWGHRLTACDHRVTTIGKLHFRDPKDDTGFPDQRLPMHIHEGVGDLVGLIREELVPLHLGEKVLVPRTGQSQYTIYDAAIADEARRFLVQEASGYDKPWALFCSFALPHHPLIAPQEYMDMYPPESVLFPNRYSLQDRPSHPAIEDMRRVLGIESELDEVSVRHAVAAYYAMCTYMDFQVGRVLNALDEAGLRDATRVIYTSDHGDSVGEHGLWMKHTMYEGSAGVPFIMAGPGLAKGKVVRLPISLVDCFPTILDCLDVPLEAEDADLPGTSLLPVALGEKRPERSIFGEYHALGSRRGFFMIRGDRYKYIEYIGYKPQLFDLVDDPGELHDLAGDPRFEGVLEQSAAELRRICNPIDTDRLAHEDQCRKLKEHGGVDAVKARGFKIPFTPAPIDLHPSGT